MKRRNQEGILFMELPSFEQVMTRHQLGQTVEEADRRVPPSEKQIMEQIDDPSLGISSLLYVLYLSHFSPIMIQ